MLLLHPASGGHGLNLQHGGHTAVWYGLTHDLELYQQFNARLHRSGQKSSRVFIHHILARDTVDEIVYGKILPGKAASQAEVLRAVNVDLGVSLKRRRNRLP